MEPFLHGLILAFGLILPLGVQNIFIFTQGAIQKPFIKALPAVVTAGVCDTLLISLAVTGVSLLVLGFDVLRNLLYVVGFFFLLYMGWTMWKSKINVPNQNTTVRFSAKRQIVFAASVSLLNPHAILDTIGVIGTSSLSYIDFEKWVFTITCIVVSWLWFFGLAILGRQVGKVDVNGQLLGRINKISAIVIWGMALYFAYTFLVTIN
ncbi:LysE/ArgO family amino acid transporter [Paenisporosarcina sp. TG20]|uniref:LysE/ArgO family amino acid transporter n=1 Tax=Paenisporosarcina sp. TG20 TaxID=1211706 RepID=UPI0002F80228|nr:LysE/ArgO family amino acid transporter [Paenisporosarcina sp. TG20]